VIFRYSSIIILFVSLFVSLFVLGSCKRENVARSHNSKQKNKDDIFSPVSICNAKRVIGLKYKNHEEFINIVKQVEAKFSDVPIPLDSFPIEYSFDGCIESEENTFGYRSSISIKDLTHFYCQEMERLGWCKIIVFDGFEKLLNFQKPSKFCSISIRPCLGKSKKIDEYVDIVIFYKK